MEVEGKEECDTRCLYFLKYIVRKRGKMAVDGKADSKIVCE